MRPLLRAYVFSTVLAATLLLAFDLARLPARPDAWTVSVALALAAASVGAGLFTFQVDRGWSTSAGAVPHVAAAFLLPPGLAELVAVVGASARALSRRQATVRAMFNLAGVALTVGVASHVATAFGGRTLATASSGWPGLPVAVLTASVYYCTTSSVVAGVVAIEQRRPFLAILRGKMGTRLIAEVGLGLVGAILAVLITEAPGWSFALVPPAILVYLAKQAMEGANRRSRDLALTSAVGRAVAGTLNPERAFEAIAARGVRDALKLDGLALVPLGDPPDFREHLAADHDQPELRRVLAQRVAQESTARRLTLPAAKGQRAAWLPPGLEDLRVAAAAVPFGAGAERPIGVLLAWRSRRGAAHATFGEDDLLVLETLADYAAVALETARLANEMARMSRDAAAAEAVREVEALRELAQLKDEFLGQVSHELRTPLTIIHGYAELASDGLLLDGAELRQTAREIHVNSALMLRLVDDLLDTSRLESGRLSLKLETIDLAPWLERTVAAFAQATPTHHVVTQVHTPLPPVRVDPARMGQVMNNLLSNAARYSAPGTTIRVTARRSPGADEVQISVLDQGVGIAPDERSRIFEKFYRGKDGATLAVRGTGLGLAVARSLVEAHQGTIGVESTLGRGSTFTIRLPALFAQGGNQPTTGGPLPAAGTPAVPLAPAPESQPGKRPPAESARERRVVAA